MKTTRELVQRTTAISYDRAEELLNSDTYVKLQDTPKLLLHTNDLRLDEELGGLFMWSCTMQRYYLIAKIK